MSASESARSTASDGFQLVLPTPAKQYIIIFANAKFSPRMLTLLVDGRVSVDDNPAHGSWVQENDEFMTISWSHRQNAWQGLRTIRSVRYVKVQGLVGTYQSLHSGADSAYATVLTDI